MQDAGGALLLMGFLRTSSFPRSANFASTEVEEVVCEVAFLVMCYPQPMCPFSPRRCIIPPVGYVTGWGASSFPPPPRRAKEGDRDEKDPFAAVFDGCRSPPCQRGRTGVALPEAR